MKKKRICVLCGSTIIEQSSDPYVCADCEKENAKARCLNSHLNF